MKITNPSAEFATKIRRAGVGDSVPFQGTTIHPVPMGSCNPCVFYEYQRIGCHMQDQEGRGIPCLRVRHSGGKGHVAYIDYPTYAKMRLKGEL